MSAVVKGRPEVTSNRQRLVREIARLTSESEAAGPKLQASIYQARHDVERARAALRKAETAEGDAMRALQSHDFAVRNVVQALEAELLNTAPAEIDVALAEIERTRERFRNVLTIPIYVPMSDGSRALTEASRVQVEHSQHRWDTLGEAETELHAMKLEALSEGELRKRLDAIQARVAAALHRTD
jgi:hypothetical protein